MLVCGTGYTGEDGVELMLRPGPGAPRCGSALARRARSRSGSGARHAPARGLLQLYGNDLDEDHDPIAAGLGWACAEQTGFIGADAIAKVRASGPELKLVPFVIEGPGIARQGNPVIAGGEVTSGTFSPCLERGIGMAYVSADRTQPGTRLQIDVRGTMREAVVETKPLYRKEQ